MDRRWHRPDWSRNGSGGFVDWHSYGLDESRLHRDGWSGGRRRRWLLRWRAGLRRRVRSFHYRRLRGLVRDLPVAGVVAVPDPVGHPADIFGMRRAWRQHQGGCGKHSDPGSTPQRIDLHVGSPKLRPHAALFRAYLPEGRNARESAGHDDGPKSRCPTALVSRRTAPPSLGTGAASRKRDEGGENTRDRASSRLSCLAKLFR